MFPGVKRKGNYRGRGFRAWSQKMNKVQKIDNRSLKRWTRGGFGKCGVYGGYL